MFPLRNCSYDKKSGKQSFSLIGKYRLPDLRGCAAWKGLGIDAVRRAFLPEADFERCHSFMPFEDFDKTRLQMLIRMSSKTRVVWVSKVMKGPNLRPCPEGPGAGWLLEELTAAGGRNFSQRADWQAHGGTQWKISSVATRKRSKPGLDCFFEHNGKNFNRRCLWNYDWMAPQWFTGTFALNYRTTNPGWACPHSLSAAATGMSDRVRFSVHTLKKFSWVFGRTRRWPYRFWIRKYFCRRPKPCGCRPIPS